MEKKRKPKVSRKDRSGRTDNQPPPPDKKGNYKKLIKEYNKNPGKYKVGRPREYDPSFGPIMIDWFRRDLTYQKEVVKTVNGNEIKTIEDRPTKPPTFSEFAREVLGIFTSTIYKWEKAHEEFREAVNECREIQREHIAMGALIGVYNSSFAKFTMKNISDWRDKIESHITTDEDHTVKLAYNLKGITGKAPEIEIKKDPPRRVINCDTSIK